MFLFLCPHQINQTYVDYMGTLDSVLKNVSSGLAPSTLWTSHTQHSHLTSPFPAKVPEECQTDHPWVTFWHKADWTTYQEREKSRPTDLTQGDGWEDTMAMYIKVEAGVPVSATTLEEIRKTA